ncbi:MarR family transcriptional regulator [Spiractinospora alimapuensis]|uniref:MarR family winged helix-turn-helix transcriptional regulator n=1 Tax=Spiractinospora alimapuensis TaxID=2820884 RepID=UPI001F223F0A|nr:MarR family transcriptional regulator [Spiractinospora alimapuensis]QVQ51956.1 MarR family transcriptional regulator [Spiractinospora alimapuensis]
MSSDRAPVEAIEGALVRIRRDQQARRLHRRAAEDGAAARGAADAARFRYLDALDGAPRELAISEVAEAIGVDRPRASRLTRELIADGLVEHGSDARDSRYTRLRLTHSGQELVDAVRARRRRAVADALGGFTAEEARTLAVLLDRFVDAWPRGSN